MMRTVAALAGRDLRRFFRQPSRIVGSAAQPLILWAVLGAGFAGSFRPGGGAGVGYLQYFYPGVVVLTLLFTAIFSTISVIEDRHHGFLQAVLAAPVSRVALVLGKSLGGVAIATIQVDDPAAAGAAGRVPADVDELAAARRSLIPLAALGFTALGFAMAWWIDSTQGYHAVMSVALIPLWMLSGAMFPPTGGSRWLAVLTALDPMTYAVSAIRRGFHGAAMPLDLIPARSSL